MRGGFSAHLNSRRALRDLIHIHHFHCPLICLRIQIFTVYPNFHRAFFPFVFILLCKYYVKPCANLISFNLLHYFHSSQSYSRKVATFTGCLLLCYFRSLIYIHATYFFLLFPLSCTSNDDSRSFWMRVLVVSFFLFFSFLLNIKLCMEKRSFINQINS